MASRFGDKRHTRKWAASKEVRDARGIGWDVDP